MRSKNRWKISPTKENVIYFYQIFTYHFISFNFSVIFSILFTVDKNVVFSRFVFCCNSMILKNYKSSFSFFFSLWYREFTYFFVVLLLCKIRAMIKAPVIRTKKFALGNKRMREIPSNMLRLFIEKRKRMKEKKGTNFNTFWIT